MDKVSSIENLPREEQIDLAINMFSGHEREIEIANILSILASCRITNDDYIKYYDGLVAEEIKERINDSILNNKSDHIKDIWQEENNAWNCIINALSMSTVFEIMHNWKRYVGLSIKIESLLYDTRKKLYTEFLLN